MGRASTRFGCRLRLGTLGSRLEVSSERDGFSSLRFQRSPVSEVRSTGASEVCELVNILEIWEKSLEQTGVSSHNSERDRLPEELQGAVFRPVRFDELSDLLDQVVSTPSPRARRLVCKRNENVRIGEVGVLAGLERLCFGGNETGTLAGVRTVGHAEGVGNGHIETQGFPKSPGSQGLAVGTGAVGEGEALGLERQVDSEWRI